MSFKWRTCANCGDTPVLGFLCYRCVRAAVIPLVFAAIVDILFDWMSKGFSP